MSYDQDLDDFPHMDSTAEGNGFRLLRNDLCGAVVVVHREEGALDATYVVSRKGETDDVVPKDAQGYGVISLDVTKARTAYAEAWLRAVAVEIGLGFHVDTPAGQYEPPLPEGLGAQYDDMISYAHDNLQNPYEVTMAAWLDAGLVSDGPKP